ncbi:class I SAM-dependent DNA methyltransferase [uncultured Nocardioides sp.]|uniref:type I restriction-modification system subunit M n=1 Tax=uncultured Nocardioides sp. TaxID=198441 RepID=UPI0026207DB8|nr:class I SAM-dependent DNA methyltransferase [uncultured Nocardioides sp.]
MAPQGFSDKVAFVWKVADKLRGTFKQHEYGSVMLPLLVLRRMDAVLEPTKQAVLDASKGMSDIGPGQEAILKKVAGQRFFNASPLTIASMLNDDKNLDQALAGYIRRLSPDAYAVMEAYNVDDKIARMQKAGILYAVLADFADLDLRPSVVSNEAMGYIFEELLRKFSEMSNETAGEHYTPREVIDLMVHLMLTGRTAGELTENPKPVRTVYDPSAGTGGMLMGALHRIEELNPGAVVKVYGQELNDETWAIAQSDLMMQDIDPKQMANGNTLVDDAFATLPGFDFILANPPYGVDWKGYAGPIKDEHSKRGFDGRFGAGLPRVSDGSLLFLQHMLSKMKPGGSRVGIVLSGSPLFSGQAGSGESEIRRWILENDWLEGIVALPDQMFYNTGISTYVWILTNDKAEQDRGVVKLVDGRELGTKMRKSLGDKRKELTPDAIAQLVQLYGGALGEHAADPRVRVLSREMFGFQRITVERPLRPRWEVTSAVLGRLDMDGREATDLRRLIGVQADSEEVFRQRLFDAYVRHGCLPDHESHLLPLSSEYDGWEAHLGIDRTHYDIGFDEERDTWIATRGGTWDDVVIEGEVDAAATAKALEHLVHKAWCEPGCSRAFEPGPGLIRDGAPVQADMMPPPVGLFDGLVSLGEGTSPNAPALEKRGKVVADPKLRDQENVSLPAGFLDLGDEERAKVLREAAEEHLVNEIHPYVADAWIDHTKSKLGFEIPFTRQFYVYTPPRPVEEIASEIRELEDQIQEWMQGLGL